MKPFEEKINDFNTSRIAEEGDQKKISDQVGVASDTFLPGDSMYEENSNSMNDEFHLETSRGAAGNDQSGVKQEPISG